MNKSIPEEIVLRYSRRGMDTLKNHLDKYYCRKAAEKIINTKRGNVLLTTGFYVEGYAETDGPLGTVAVALALNKLGFHSIIVTDLYCKGFFEIKGIDVEYVDIDSNRDVYDEILKKYQPVYLISIERCGKNSEYEYANMHGISITKNTAPIDFLFELAGKQQIPTIGVGDGGNEIGMGNLQKIIKNELKIDPCIISVDDLVIGTTSNWGAYALVSYLEYLTGKKVMTNFEEMKDYLCDILKIGCVDGVKKKKVMGVDGFDMLIEKEILDDLERAIV